jgi:hypothetical protein
MLRRAALFLLLVIPVSLAAQVAPADSIHLVGVSQQLMDAITSGDTAVWAATLAPDWFLTDEEGNHIGRSAQLAALHPLPDGQTGRITVTRPQFTGGNDVAVITYDADEVHHYYGQTLLTIFHATDTYVRRDGRWWQIASQVTALPRVIEGTPVPRRVAANVAGTYDLTPAIALTITAGDSGILLGRAGRPAQLLKQSAEGVFVRDHVRGFWVFERDARGRVIALVNWRDNNPVRWTRR